MTTSPAPGALLLAAAHRTIRHLSADEGPFVGRLVADGEHVRVLVPATELGGWVGWNHASAEHVAVPLDVARHEDGLSALLPWCTVTATDFYARRIAAGEPVTSGEIVTLVVSLLRGVHELADAHHDTMGEWWLTHDGRPLFVLGDGREITEATSIIIADIADGSTDRALCRVLDQIMTDLAEPRRLARSIDRREEELLALASPRPLRQEVFAPARVDALRSERTRRPRGTEGLRNAPGQQSAAPVPRAPQATGLRHFVRRLGEQVEERIDNRRSERQRHATSRAQERAAVRPSPQQGGETVSHDAPRRVRPLTVGIAAATVVVVVGVLWPSTPDGTASAREGQWLARVAPADDAPDAPDTAESDAPTVEAPPVATAKTDPLSAFPEVLNAVLHCADGDSSACGESIAADTTGPVVERLAPGGNDRTAVLVDDYGDVAAVRLGTSPEGDVGEQIVVLVKEEQKWRVRDVYDVADPPEG